MTAEERKRALKKLTKNQVFCDLKQLINDKSVGNVMNVSLSINERISAVNVYRAKKHVEKFLRCWYNRYLVMSDIGNKRRLLRYEYSFIRCNLEELPRLKLISKSQTSGNLGKVMIWNEKKYLKAFLNCF